MDDLGVTPISGNLHMIILSSLWKSPTKPPEIHDSSGCSKNTNRKSHILPLPAPVSYICYTFMSKKKTRNVLTSKKSPVKSPAAVPARVGSGNPTPLVSKRYNSSGSRHFTRKMRPAPVSCVARGGRHGMTYGRYGVMDMVNKNVNICHIAKVDRLSSFLWILWNPNLGMFFLFITRSCWFDWWLSMILWLELLNFWDLK